MNDNHITFEKCTQTFPWGNDGIITTIKRGSGSLKFSWYDNYTEGFLLLNSVPLIKWKQFCESCASLLASGYGIDNISMETIEIIRKSSAKFHLNLEDIISDLIPLLLLLENGKYLVSMIDHYPTDGQGNYFWKPINEYTQNELTRDRIDACGCIAAYPKCLVATQAIEKYNKTQVEYYRKQIRSGEKMGGIAYYIGGFMSALLDGHHRATAALIENVSFTCITIIPRKSINEQPVVETVNRPSCRNNTDFKYDEIIDLKARQYPDPANELWNLVTNNTKYEPGKSSENFWKNVSNDKTVSNWRDF